MYDASGNLSGHSLAYGKVEVRAAPQERLYELELAISQEMKIIRPCGLRSSDAPVGMDGSERLLKNDDRTGNKITEALVLVVKKHSKAAHAIKKRELIFQAHEVSRYGLIGINRSTRFLNDSQFQQALTGRLSVPNSFKEREIRRIDHKQDKKGNGANPYPSALRRNSGESDEDQSDYRENGDHQGLNQGVERYSKKAAANARERKIQKSLLGCLNGKLVDEAVAAECGEAIWRLLQRIHRCSPRDGSQNANPIGPSSRNFSNGLVNVGSQHLHTESCKNSGYCTGRRPVIWPPSVKTPRARPCTYT